MNSRNLNLTETICRLKQNGYYEDFILFGNDLFWVQQKAFVDSSEFCIADCMTLAHPKGKDHDLVLYCIEIMNLGKRGILMNSYCFTSDRPSIILRKLHDLKFYSSQAPHSFY